MYYFNILPMELNVLICSKLLVGGFIQMKTSKVIKPLLKDPLFWNMIIKIRMPDLDLRYVPSYLYTYKNINPMICVTNYILLRRTYEKCKELMKYCNLGLVYSISDFKDLNVITFEYIKGLTMRGKFKNKICVMLLNPYGNDKAVIMTMKSTNICYITIKTQNYDIIYQINSQDLFNMLVHIHCYKI